VKLSQSLNNLCGECVCVCVCHALSINDRSLTDKRCLHCVRMLQIVERTLRVVMCGFACGFACVACGGNVRCMRGSVRCVCCVAF
jgi:hypothetical protein